MSLAARLRAAGAFVNNLDAKAWRTIAATVALLVLISVVFVLGKQAIGDGGGQAIERWLASFRDSPWALAVVVAIFTVTAFMGAPQFLLIAACVVAFGPWLGSLYSWIATLVSAAVTYYVGRIAGADAMRRFGGRRLNKLAASLGRNAFFGSFAIRNLPSAPFIVVNMAFGMSRASFTGFILGCALGIIPKTALVALFGGGFRSAVAGDGIWTSAILIGVGLLWLGLMLGVRELLRRRGVIRTGEDAEA